MKDERIRLHISELPTREVPSQSCRKGCFESFGTYPQQGRTAYTSKEIEAWFFQMERRQGTL